MESSLIFKTFVILGSQLFLVFAICLFVIKRARLASETGTSVLGVTFTKETNSKGELDLQPAEDSYGLQVLTWISIISMFAMVFLSHFSLTMGLLTMATTSITLGPVLAMIMLNMDENDGRAGYNSQY